MTLSKSFKNEYGKTCVNISKIQSYLDTFNHEKLLPGFILKYHIVDITP